MKINNMSNIAVEKYEIELEKAYREFIWRDKLPN